jgi:sugar (pentulose or hexulose) kinase
MAMSVVMGVFLAARHVLALIEEATGDALREVEMVSRGVHNPQWGVLARRALGTTLRLHDDADMSARGAAMLALALDGTPVVQASRRLSAQHRVVEPTSAEIESARGLLVDYRRASQYSLEWRNRDGVVHPNG